MNPNNTLVTLGWTKNKNWSPLNLSEPYLSLNQNAFKHNKKAQPWNQSQQYTCYSKINDINPPKKVQSLK